MLKLGNHAIDMGCPLNFRAILSSKLVSTTPLVACAGGTDVRSSWYNLVYDLNTQKKRNQRMQYSQGTPGIKLGHLSTINYGTVLLHTRFPTLHFLLTGTAHVGTHSGQ